MQERTVPIAGSCQRRTLLGIGLGMASLCAEPARAGAPDGMPPQPGDHFVFLIGPKKGSIVHAVDLPVGGPQVQAYPADPSGVVRNALRLNLILLIRLDPASMSDDTAGRAADGVVAYSGVCTHQGCPVNMWSTDRNAFVCSCHGSIYNPRDSATVMFGPAPKQLPALPLKTENGVLLVASGFTAKVGAAQV